MKLKKISSIFLTVAISVPTFMFGSYADSNIVKYAGKDRIATSISTANTVNSDKVVFSSAYNFADSLSAFNIAVKNNAKLVLIDNKTDVSTILSGKTKAYIIGGENVLNKNTENKIKSVVADTERISGNDRYQTNKKSLEAAGYKEVGVADGRNYPDALSASGLLADRGLGLLLVNGSKPYSTEYNVKYTFGGKNSVSQNGGERIAGKDRYETSRLINRKIDGLKTVVYTSGENYADALSSINLINKSSKTGVVLLKYIADKDKAGFTSVSNQASVGNLVYKKYTAPKVNGITVIKTSPKPTAKEIDNILLEAMHSGNLDVGIKVGEDSGYYGASEYLTTIYFSMLFNYGEFENYNGSNKNINRKMRNLTGCYDVENKKISTQKYKEHLEKLRAIVDAAGVKPGDSTRNKAILVAKYLKHHYGYYEDYLKTDNPSAEMIYKAAGPFTITDFDKSICSGYTGIYNQIMFMLGIPSYTIEGSASWIIKRDKKGNRIYVVDHANPNVYYNNEWHELNVTGNNVRPDTLTACKDLFINPVDQTPEVKEQKIEHKKIYAAYKDFYLKINPDLEKVDNSKDSRFDVNEKVLTITSVDENGVKHIFNSEKEWRDYYEPIAEKRRAEYQKKVEESRRRRKEIEEKIQQIEEKKRFYEEQARKRKLEVEKERIEDEKRQEEQRKNEAYAEINSRDFDERIVNEINRRRGERGMSPLKVDDFIYSSLYGDLEKIKKSYGGSYQIEEVIRDGKLKDRNAKYDTFEFSGRITPEQLVGNLSLYMNPNYKYISVRTDRQLYDVWKVVGFIVVYGDTQNSSSGTDSSNRSQKKTIVSNDQSTGNKGVTNAEETNVQNQ